jgi:PAS domain S-box-containing protein
MTIEELVRVFAESLATGIVLTEAVLEAPGPMIRYVNPAFCRLTGYAAEELVGNNPRILQGPDTQRLTLRRIARTLGAGSRFHGVVSNYRKSGEVYLCEIDVRPIRGNGGGLEGFIAFEREVVRPRGRPREDGLKRFRPLAGEDPVLSALPGLSPFS